MGGRRFVVTGGRAVPIFGGSNLDVTGLGMLLSRPAF